ncbi:MAG TPA: hypothetical protein VEK11_18845 [Thermoanaerobaculia bacterium]|jgi:hypothetical protein|nr:hypothetical protein [Thermoanaerobaculia bacterium]
MRVALFVFALLLAGSAAAEPVYMDELVETPLATLQTLFPGLRKEGCYRLANGQHLQITMDKKDGKPWRVSLATQTPCRKVQEGPTLDLRHRKGVALGDSTLDIIEKMGRPDASAAPDAALRKLGETEYLYMCRVSEGCARHTSVFIRDGVVSAVSEWYSE